MTAIGSSSRPLFFVLIISASVGLWPTVAAVEVNAEGSSCNGADEQGDCSAGGDSASEFSLMQKGLAVTDVDHDRVAVDNKVISKPHRPGHTQKHVHDHVSSSSDSAQELDKSVAFVLCFCGGCLAFAVLTLCCLCVCGGGGGGDDKWVANQVRKEADDAADYATGPRKSVVEQREEAMEVMRRRSLDSQTPIEDFEVLEGESIDHDLYGHTIASLCRDAHQIFTKDGSRLLRATRMASSIALLFSNIGIQLFLLYGIKTYIADMSVVSIRHTYDLYETTMYGNDTSHLRTVVGGQLRGIPEYFDQNNFDKLDPTLKVSVCSIPFSQPAYLCAILFIWSLTCVAELKGAMNQFNLYIISLPNTSMDHMLEHEDEDDSNAVTVVGLPVSMKLLILECVILPRILTTCYLMWLGCRWLAATPNMTDILTNTVALEFVLLLKELLYHTLVTARSKREVENTKVCQHDHVTKAGYCAFLGTIMWGAVAAGWVFYYVFYFQMVLQEYNWDVRSACSDYLAAAHDTSR